ncbi:TPA: hypothetical protein MYO83_000540 [Klebsiella michiganensis]|nr:hypothetical protein [Klebsiella michiganensis]HCB1844960.1 hypothetical protein [Klebsiella oxytoca]
MYRTINVHVDESSWPGVGNIPSFPAAFTAGTNSFDLNINSMLLMIGYLTTPTSVTGVSLAEFWAWVRYLAAITPRDADLRLTRSYADLDAHQKTILSDDFGMGVPMVWLMKNLPLVEIVDGSYFLQRYGANHGAHQHRTAKRGPNKTPDFVARGHDGNWHIMECKGTQSGEAFRDRQIDSGISQKLSIMFPPGHTGQRLVSGLSIGIEDGNPSHLRIIDPVPEDPVKITESELEFAKDAATRGVMAKLLRSTGFETAAEAVAAPFGKPQAMPPSTKKTDKKRIEFLADRDRRAREELLESTSRRNLFDGRYRGREVAFQLPRPIYIHGAKISKVIVRQGINMDALDLLREQPTIETLIDPSRNHWVDMMGTNIIHDDEKNATLQIGNIFRSELILE